MYKKKELCVKFVIYKNYTEMDGQKKHKRIPISFRHQIQQKTGFDSRSVPVRFVVDKVQLGLVYFRVVGIAARYGLDGPGMESR